MNNYLTSDVHCRKNVLSDSLRSRDGLNKIIIPSVVLPILFLGNIVYAQFSGGSGTVVNPYLISSYTDLKGFSDSVSSVTGVSYRSAVYRLTANIDASASVSEDDGKGFRPIGSYTARFSGTFHGGGYIISNITINRTTEFTGFFGFIETGGIVDSIGLKNVDITSSHNYNGVLAAHNGGSISYCFSSGTIVGNNRTGGLVGFNPSTGSISHSYSSCSVTGNLFVGGLVGRNEEGTISQSYSSCTIVGNGTVGGFIGYYSGGSFSNNLWNRETAGVSSTIGTPGGDSSGISGCTTLQMKTQSTYTDAGWNFTTVWKSKYNTYPRLKWEKILTGSGTDGDPFIIAVYDDLKWIADNLSSVYKLVADINASASASENSSAGFEPIGTNTTPFTGKFRGGGYTISNLTINRSGTDYVGLFGKINHVNALVDSLGLENADITGNNYTGGVSGYFSGSSISYVHSTAADIHGNMYVGGVIGSANNSISKSHSSGTVTATGNYSGGLVGAGGPISNSYSICTVTSSSNFAGGLVGFAYNVSDCYSNGSVQGSTYVGGLAGTVMGSVTKSYSTSTVSGSSAVGGFCGEYYTGMTSGSACFWDTQTSGKSNAAGAGSPPSGSITGRTTAEMQTQSTFTNAGWNFSDVWEIVGTNYPRLLTNVDPALPIELISFYVKNISTAVHVYWKTATETNNYGFDVERSAAGYSERNEGARVWHKIGFVEGNGTTNAAKQYSFVDHSAIGNVLYRLKQLDRDGKVSYSQQVEIAVGVVPAEFVLEQNYPNPFNPSTSIGFTLQMSGLTTLKIYDAIGREVAELVNEHLEAGAYHQKTFDASRLASGIYFVRLQSGKSVQMKKMILVK